MTARAVGNELLSYVPNKVIYKKSTYEYEKVGDEGF